MEGSGRERKGRRRREGVSVKEGRGRGGKGKGEGGERKRQRSGWNNFPFTPVFKSDIWRQYFNEFPENQLPKFPPPSAAN